MADGPAPSSTARRAIPKTACRSSACGATPTIEYAVDESARTVREVWTSAADDDPERVISRAMGDAHRLANDNMLIVDSTCLPMRKQLTRNCHVRDLTWNERKREEWHPNELVSWQTFGAARAASLYPPGVERAS